jgi:tRNA threonylcarbamoyladenosine biosynthesis protein TsaE
MEQTSTPSAAPPPIELPTRRASRELSRRLAPCLAAGDLVIYSGPLGSGKTFLVRALGRALGLAADVPVTSPTFTLVNEYATEPPLCHADLYRLGDVGQVEMLGLRERRDEGSLVLVEWGEPFIDVLGGDALVVSLASSPRRAALQATGPRSGAVLAALLKNA